MGFFLRVERKSVFGDWGRARKRRWKSTVGNEMKLVVVRVGDGVDEGTHV